MKPMGSVDRRTAPAKGRVAAVSILLDSQSLTIPESARTLSGFREWVKSDAFPEKQRVTYVDGEIYLDMSKETIPTHALPKTEISRVLTNLNRKLKLGYFFLDGVLITNVDAGVSNNPDGTLVSFEGIHSGRVRFHSREQRPGQQVEIEGTPDWLMEILSDSSVQKDTQKLRAAYHR